VEQKPKKWRWGFKRWILLAVIIGNVIASQYYAPVLPHIQMAAEKLPSGLAIVPLAAGILILILTLIHRAWEGLLVCGWMGVLAALPTFFDGFTWTNTLTALVISMTILTLIGLSVRRATRSRDLVPRGFSGAVEAILEVIYNLTESTAGKWAKTIFPFFATITLLVLVSNWTELLPGVDSIGILEPVKTGVNGHAIKELLPGVSTVTKGEVAGGETYLLTPFVRVLSTDLNFTVALALIAVTMTQVIGVKAQGAGYFTKFWNTRTVFSKPFFGVLDWVVGILETISEFSKVLSFSFRLFGNIFAGSVLLFVIGYIVPYFAQSGFLMLEFFVGAIQAIVFGMLAMVFMSQATQGHGGHEEEHH
jgi:F-type H+-transporting ATPase subunit a